MKRWLLGFSLVPVFLVAVSLSGPDARAEIPYPACLLPVCTDPYDYAAYLFLPPGVLPDDYAFDPLDPSAGSGWKYAPDLLQYYDAKTKIEQELYLIMLEYRQRTFQGAFHASNDYMHWYGWAPLKTAVNTILEEEKRMRAEHGHKKVSAGEPAVAVK